MFKTLSDLNYDAPMANIFLMDGRKFFHVDGKVTSLIFTCGCIGVIVNPIILSRTIERNPTWFCYILLAESCMLFVLYTVAVYLARFIKRKGLKNNRCQEITIETEISSPLAEDTNL